MQELINWWNLNLGDHHENNLIDAFRNKKLSYNSIGKTLEKKIAELFKVKHCLLTTSGSTSLLVALKSLNIGEGDEVIVPNRTFQATANAVCLAGAKVKLVDVSAVDGLIDVNLIENQINSKTKAILPVHLNGRACDMKSILKIAEKHNLFVIEDTAQAFMSSSQNRLLGSFGDVGCFSLGVTKFITSGQGGFLITNSDSIYEHASKYIFHSATGTDLKEFNDFGFNFRLSDLLSSLALADFENIDTKRSKYLDNYERYNEKLQNIKTLSLIRSKTTEGEVPIWIEILSENRDELFSFLKKHNIESVKFYPSLHRSSYLGHQDISFPQSEKFEKKGLILPCGPDISTQQIDRVIEKIREF